MPDFSDIEQIAKEHSQQVDEGIEKAEQEGNQRTDNRYEKEVDAGATEAEKFLGNDQSSGGKSPNS